MYLTWEVSCINAFWCLGAECYSLSSATGYESLAENPLKLGQTSSADALRLIIRRTEEVEIGN